ncbi:MAG: hypothetical protein A2017_01375 [Lentisphaerae bacterium GWF2_44_16]|nr:MAG: hypothetical protein A2017_01375 [Lentisphaerae bacterium GWF2_44_16]
MLRKHCMALLCLLTVSVSAENLIENGSFEDKTDKPYNFKIRKRLDDGKTLEKASKEEIPYGIADDNPRTGQKSFRFQSNIQGGGTEINYSPKVPMKSRTKYLFTAYYFLKAGENPGKLRVAGRVTFFDKDKKVIKYLFPEAPVKLNEWLPMKVEFFPPVGAESAAFTLWCGAKVTVWWDDISLVEIKEEKDASAYSYHSKLAENSDMLAWKEMPNVKIPYKDIPSDMKNGKLEISCALNESEPFQLILNSKRDISEVSLEFADLKNSSGKSIGKENLSYKPVGYINIKEAENPSVIGMNADPLMPEKTVPLKTGVNSPFWVMVNVPQNTAPGIYEGSLKIICGKTETASIPLSLKVRSFAIPEMPFLQSAFYGKCFPNRMGLFDHRTPDETEKDIFENLKEHRITGNQAYSVPIPKYQIKDGILEITDWSPLDNFMSEKINKYHMNWFKFSSLGFYGDNGGWYGTKKTAFVFGKDIQTPEGRSLLSQYVKLLSAHLREKGWFEKSSSYVWDEPPDPLLKVVGEICDAIHAGDRNFDILTTRKITPELKGKINTWCLPCAHGYIDMEEIGKAFKRNEKIWIYNWPIRLDDYEYIKNRLFPWIAYMLDAEGVLLWQILHTNGGNPWTEMNKVGFNMGATLLYPHPSGKGPYIDSQRFAIVKESIDDYDYFKTLEKKIDSVKPGWGKTRVKEIISALIYKPPFDYNNDSSLLYHIRDEIAEEIETMDKAPLLLARTNPPDNSSTILNEITIEGICEKGVKITINGEPVKAEEGIFSKKIFLGSIGKNTIKIEAEHNGAKKTVFRNITLDKDPQIAVLKNLLDKAVAFGTDVSAFNAVYNKASSAKDYSEALRKEVAVIVTECQKKIIQAQLGKEAKNAKNKLYTTLFSRAKWSIDNGFFEKAEHYLKEAAKIGPDTEFSKESCFLKIVNYEGHFGFLMKNSLIEVLILESGARILDFKTAGVSCLHQGNPKDYPEEVRADMKKCIELVQLKFRPQLGGYEDAGMEQAAAAYADWKIFLVELKPDRISLAAEINMPGDKFRLTRLMTLVKDDPRLELKYTIENIQPVGFKSDDPCAYDFPWRGHTDIAIGGSPEGNILVIPTDEKLKCLEFSSANPVFYEAKTVPLTEVYAGSFSPEKNTGFVQILDEKIKNLYVWFHAADSTYGSGRVYTIEPNMCIGVKPMIVEPGQKISFTNYFVGLSGVKDKNGFVEKTKSYINKSFGK